MLKRTLLTMTALSSLILISPALHDTAIAGQFNKPMIRIISPSVKMRINTRRLVSRKDATKPALPVVQAAASRSSKNKAGPQPEPPTYPKQTKATNVTKPDLASLPRPRPYNEFEEDGNGSDIDVADVVPPELPVSPAFFDLFGITGNPNDLKDVVALEDILAMQGFEQPIGADPFEDPAGQLRPPRFGASMDGPPNADDGTVSDSGKASNATGQGSGSSGPAWTWVSATKGGRSNTRTYERPSEGGGTDRFTIIIDSAGKAIVQENGSTGEVTLITIGPADENGESEITVATGQQDEEGSASLQTESAGTTNGDSVPTEMDRDGDGEPDAVANPEGPQPTSQPAPDGSSAGGGVGGCGVWTPFGGCMGTGLKIWEITGQPDTSGDGTATAGSAGPSIGPEAVTNSGDGSFTAGGNTGGGGGMLDPCATVRGCGDGHGGPGGPAASMEGVNAARN